jgi:hypothetical protein
MISNTIKHDHFGRKLEHQCQVWNIEALTPTQSIFFLRNCVNSSIDEINKQTIPSTMSQFAKVLTQKIWNGFCQQNTLCLYCLQQQETVCHSCFPCLYKMIYDNVTNPMFSDKETIIYFIQGQLYAPRINLKKTTNLFIKKAN